MTLRAVLVLLVLTGGAAASPPLLDPPTARLSADGSAAAGASAPSAGDAPRRSAEPAVMSPVPDGLGERERVVLPPMTVPQAAPTPDRRPAYVGLGLVVMAVALWWNRRQRDRFDREDDRARRPRRVRVRDAERDADADDLHAAARGDAPDPPAGDAPARPSRQDV